MEQCNFLRITKHTHRHVDIHRTEPLILLRLTLGHPNPCSVFATACLFMPLWFTVYRSQCSINISALEHQKAAHFSPLHTHKGDRDSVRINCHFKLISMSHPQNSPMRQNPIRTGRVNLRVTGLRTHTGLPNWECSFYWDTLLWLLPSFFTDSSM